MKTKTTSLVVVLWVVAAGASVPRASADPIGPGFDLWNTVVGTTVDLGVLGIIPLEGVPLNGLGDTDTIVERITGSPPVFNPGDSTTIDIEIVALSLKSVAPVDIGGIFFDLDIISGSLLGEPANPLGQMQVDHTIPNGGTLTVLSLPVDAKATFTQVGNPLNTFSQIVPIIFEGANGVWSHSPGPMDQHDLTLPSGGFYGGIDPLTGDKAPPISHPAGAGFPPGHVHVVRTAMPEPSSIALAVLGAVCFLPHAWRRIKRTV